MNHHFRARSMLYALMLAWCMTLALLPTGSVRADGGAPNLAYVAGSGADGNALSIIDIGQRKVTHTVALGGSPWGVVLSSDNRYAYVTQNGANALAILDTRTYAVTGTVATGAKPLGIAIDYNDASQIYVANSGAGTVTVIDPDHARVLATIPVGQQPMGISIAGPGTSITSGSQVYVANAGSDSVSVIDAASHQVIATVPVPGGPQYVVVPANASVAYVATHSGSIVVIALATQQVVGTLVQRPGASFGLMDYDAITSQIYVPDGANGQVAILAPVTANDAGAPPTEPAQQFAVAGSPSAVAITFDGAYAFVAQRDAGQVLMLDATTRHTLATVAVGGTPHSIITGSYPPILDRQTATYVGIGVSVAFLVGCIIVLYFFSRRMRKGASANAPAS